MELRSVRGIIFAAGGGAVHERTTAAVQDVTTPCLPVVFDWMWLQQESDVDRSIDMGEGGRRGPERGVSARKCVSSGLLAVLFDLLEFFSRSFGKRPF